MTAVELYHELQERGVVLTPAPEGTLRYRAPTGVLTPFLREAMRQHKPALLALVAPGTPSLRQWVTGATLTTQTQGVLTLPSPIVHDVPSPPETHVGPLCAVQACRPTTRNQAGEPASTYFHPSGLCVGCYARLRQEYLETKTTVKALLLSLPFRT